MQSRISLYFRPHRFLPLAFLLLALLFSWSRGEIAADRPLPFTSLPGRGVGQERIISADQLASIFPLYFTKNRGQAQEEVEFLLKLPAGCVSYTRDSIHYKFLQYEPREQTRQSERDTPKTRARPGSFSSQNITMQFIKGTPDVKVNGEEKTEALISYFLGNDPEKWVRGAETYHRLRYNDLYPNIDLVIRGGRENIKHEYIVKPGADPEDIRLRVDGIKALRINEKSQLELVTDNGILVQDAPVSFQVIEGKRVELETEYIVENDFTFGFRLADYRKEFDLVIDPYLQYSTYLGGGSSEAIIDVAFDSSGYAYVTGWTDSTNFPVTSGAFDTGFNTSWCDAFVAKLDYSGGFLRYATYLGGSDTGWAITEDIAYGIAVDASGNAFVAGYTKATNFPTTPGAYDTSHNGAEDAFITKLNSTGTALLYSTYFGTPGDTSGDDDAWCLAIDQYGNAYIGGTTECPSFPTTPGAYDRTFNNAECFVTKLNASGSAIIYSTFLGGSHYDDWIHAIAVDSSGSAYVTGFAYSTDFPTTPGAYDITHNGFRDVFVTKLSSSGSSLVYSTLLGGSEYDTASGIAVDDAGNAFIAGFTRSPNFPTTSGAYDRFLGGTSDAFVSKLSPSGGSLVFSTFLGGDEGDSCWDIDMDADGNAWVSGTTSSSNFPITDGAIRGYYSGGSDAFLSRISAAGTSLLYSTYVGGGGYDSGSAVAVDEDAHIYAAGYTYSTNFPTTAYAHDRFLSGSSDGYVLKLLWIQPPLSVSLVRDINRSLFRKEAFHTIRWSHNSVNNAIGIMGYRIYRRLASQSDEDLQPIGQVLGSWNEYVDRYLDVNLSYVYAVTAVDTDGCESLYSSRVGN